MYIYFPKSSPILIYLLGMSMGLLFFVPAIFAQKVEKPENATVYTSVEQQPQFPGGFGDLKAYIKTNTQYPVEAQRLGIKGLVIISFIIELNGFLTNIAVLKGLGYGCDEEALRVIRSMPCWQPGSQSGKPIRVNYNVPVLFGVAFPKQKGH